MVFETTVGDKSFETLSSNGVTLENKIIHIPLLPLPSIQSWVVWYFLQVARTAAQHWMEGEGEEKLYYVLLKSAKRHKGPLGQSVSTNFVADCSLHLEWQNM